MRIPSIHVVTGKFARHRHHHKTLRVCGLSLLVGATLAACQKTEPVQTTADRLKSVEQNQNTNPDFYAPRKTVDYMTDLKSIKDAPAKVEPAPAPPATPAKLAADAKAIPAPAVAAAPVQAVPAPVRVAEPTPPPVQVAVAAPTPRAAPPKAEPPALTALVTPTFRAQPEFPREAIRQNVETGTVRAKLTIGANGDVTNVAILESRPARLFDRAVTTSLLQWKFNAGTDGRSYTTEVSFQR